VAERGEAFDVAIIGAGLAGLTLALQLRQTSPQRTIVILEKSTFPPPAAAHKVGEATVEIGAHYLAHTLGLKSLLEESQLRKFGLRLFFGAGNRDDLSFADELGASSLLPAISYQLDRGVLETSLTTLLLERGVDIRHESRVAGVEFGDGADAHRLNVLSGNGKSTVSCRWVVDASARSAVLKRQLGLRASSRHRMSAAWFRLDETISVDDWSSDADWQARCNGLSRMPSTNHLMGCGYWAWIIPLVNGRTSIGLVTDPDTHSLATYDSFDRFRQWLAGHQPLLAGPVDAAADRLMDFNKLRNLSQDSKRVWSADRWAMTGECGVFTDPFYSPGTDFIALGNTFIADLISRDCPPAETGIRATVYEKLYRSFYESTMSLYEGQYGGFGDTRLMSIKLTWDYAYYWSILAWLFFRDVLTDLNFLREAQAAINEIRTLNESMQAHFLERAAERRVDTGRGRFVDQIGIPLMVDLNTALLQARGPLQQELQANCRRLQRLAPMLRDMLNRRPVDRSDARELLGDLERRLA
jgi:flavin-dependent dehydrogenase